MSQALSNLSCFVQQSKAQPLLGHMGDLRRRKKNSNSAVKAMASGESRPNNLDHLQRAPKHRNQTVPPRKITTPPTPPIGLWERFPTARTVQQMMETMERLMVDDPFGYSGGGRTPWEVKEGDAGYKMRFDMPGMTRDDVKVRVEDKMLVVKAQKGIEKDEDEDEDESHGDWSAKSYGRYSCRIALPENVRFEDIKAEVRDGVLYITIPKSSSASNILNINVQ